MWRNDTKTTQACISCENLAVPLGLENIITSFQAWVSQSGVRKPPVVREGIAGGSWVGE